MCLKSIKTFLLFSILSECEHFKTDVLPGWINNRRQYDCEVIPNIINNLLLTPLNQYTNINFKKITKISSIDIEYALLPTFYLPR